MVAAKAAVLYADNVRLASARLYYALLSLMRRKEAPKQSRELPARLSALAEAVGVYDDQDLGSNETMNLSYPDAPTTAALNDLAEGLRQKAFTIARFSHTIETSVGLMKGSIPTAIPVVDQETVTRLDAFTKHTLRKFMRDDFLTPEVLTKTRARGAWLLGGMLGSLPVFPIAQWDDLMELRKELQDTRSKLMRKMDEIATSRLDIGGPSAVSKYVDSLWNGEIRNEIQAVQEEANERARQFGARKMALRAIKGGVPVLGLTIGSDLLAHVAHQPLALGIPLLGLAGKVVSEIDKRREVLSGIQTFSPFWMLYQANERWGNGRQ
jgi:hypothetical protein